ncbi:hypothetical protein ILUMI_24321 [Ignelater luminosus]|uniref:Very-long-chain (3R)-3-hydroxyacyl-CoA dehydratase n=1 Tax=Ignelater luminosus TaxID=2038154 RepID=A0A8K0CCS9_IGNLU|nr:hypothetical protein ILUMI_24321 [Ignelater luminosus]
MNQQKTKYKMKNSNSIKLYLIVYNLIQTVSWSILLLRLINHDSNVWNGKTSNLYQYVKWPLLFSHILTILEIIHVVVNIVPSNIITTIMQVCLRGSVACIIIPMSIAAQNSIGLPIALHAWAVAEVTRYSYYTFNLLGFVPYLLTWLRYSVFIVAYPVGAMGELICIYVTQKQLNETNISNSSNVSTVYRYILYVSTILLIPVFPKLYMHMLKQRRKVLGKQTASTDTKNK